MVRCFALECDISSHRSLYRAKCAVLQITVRKCDDGVGVGGGTVWRDDVIDARERVRGHREEMDGERQREQWREIKRHSSTEFMLMNDN